jgi:hypothetical protein
MRLLCFILSVSLFMGTSASQAAPSQLYNKTVSIAWSVQNMMRDPDGKEHGGGSNINYTIYVSSAGRLFEQATRAVGKQSNTGNSDPSTTKSKNGEARGLRFEGNTLVANRDYSGGSGSGAMRAVISFDPSYTSCTLQVTHGKEGNTVMKRRSPDGVIREILSTTVTNTTCSVRDGNAFAN